MKIWKRNAVVAAIVLFVCVAVYLNWSYSQGDMNVNGGGVADAGGKTLGEAALVSGTAEPQTSAAPEDSGAAGSDYFDNARLTRQQARDNALSILQETMDDESAQQTVRDQAAESITTMATATVAEAQIENLVTAKGYADCVAFIGEDSLSLAVAAPESGLTEADTAKLVDVVNQSAGFTADQIKIIQVN